VNTQPQKLGDTKAPFFRLNSDKINCSKELPAGSTAAVAIVINHHIGLGVKVSAPAATAAAGNGREKVHKSTRRGHET